MIFTPKCVCKCLGVCTHACVHGYVPSACMHVSVSMSVRSKAGAFTHLHGFLCLQAL